MLYLTEMLSDTTACSDDVQRLNLAIIGENDAINLYIQLANKSKNPLVSEILLNIAKEEKVHVGELLKCISMIDPEFYDSMKEGAKEVDQLNSDMKNAENNDDADDDEDDDENLEDIEKYI